MNERFRFPIAVLVSLLLHIILLMWMKQLVKVPVSSDQGVLQVFLQNNAPGQEDRPIQLSATTLAAAIKNPIAKQGKRPAGIPELPLSIEQGRQASGHFSWQPSPLSRQDELMNGMQLARLAQQRESQRSAVMAGMSNMAVQFRPLITTKIICMQHADFGIDCTPEPEKKLHPLMEQFFSLVLEARRLGIAGNPVSMDFGPELGVSVTLLP